MATVASAPGGGELKRIGFLVGAAEASISYLSTKTQPYATRVGALYTSCKESSSALKVSAHMTARVATPHFAKLDSMREPQSFQPARETRLDSSCNPPQPQPGIVSIESAIQQYGAALVEKSKAAAPKLLQVRPSLHQTRSHAAGFRRFFPLARVLTQRRCGCYQDVDTRVDATLSRASAALERSLSTVGVSSFNEVREQYFTQLEAAMTAVQARAPMLPAEAYLAVSSAISAARSASVESAGIMLAAVVAAWEAFVAHPTVKEALCKSQLALLLLKKKAFVAMRQIHSTHTYAACEAKVCSAMAAVQHHQRYQAYVEPALDLALQRITSSVYYGCGRCHPAAVLGSGALCTLKGEPLAQENSF
jgi:hypothetical protein